jgi:hypothetical protein
MFNGMVTEQDDNNLDIATFMVLITLYIFAVVSIDVEGKVSNNTVIFQN